MTHRITVLVFLAICLCVLTVGCQGPSARDAHEEVGALSVRQRRPPSSEAQAAPNAAVAAELKKASQLADDDKLDAALSQIDRVLKTYPDHVPALLARGRVLMRMNRSRDAERSLHRAVQLEPGNLDAELMLGYCYLDQERYDEAEGTLTQLASGDGSVRQRVSAYLGLASLYDRRGQKEKVSKCYQEAINLDESVKEILIQLERQSFWPKPVTDKEGRPARSSPSMREIEKIIAEAKRTPQ